MMKLGRFFYFCIYYVAGIFILILTSITLIENQSLAGNALSTTGGKGYIDTDKSSDKKENIPKEICSSDVTKAAELAISASQRYADVTVLVVIFMFLGSGAMGILYHKNLKKMEKAHKDAETNVTEANKKLTEMGITHKELSQEAKDATQKIDKSVRLHNEITLYINYSTTRILDDEIRLRALRWLANLGYEYFSSIFVGLLNDDEESTAIRAEAAVCIGISYATIAESKRDIDAQSIRKAGNLLIKTYGANKDNSIRTACVKGVYKICKTSSYLQEEIMEFLNQAKNEVNIQDNLKDLITTIRHKLEKLEV